MCSCANKAPLTKKRAASCTPHAIRLEADAEICTPSLCSAESSPIALHLVAVQRGRIHGDVQNIRVPLVVFHPINNLAVSGHVALKAAIDDVGCHAIPAHTPRRAVCRGGLPRTGHSIMA